MPSLYKPFNSNWTQLAEGLGFQCDQDCKNWIESDEFKPLWDELVACCLKPERDLAKAKGRPVQRGPDFRTIQACLEDEDSLQSLKYKNPRGVDKTDWTMQDHLAYFLYLAVKINKKSKGGLFRSYVLVDKEELQWKIWQVYLFLSNEGEDKNKSMGRNDAPNSHQRQGKRDQGGDEPIYGHADDVIETKPELQGDGKGDNQEVDENDDDQDMLVQRLTWTMENDLTL